MDPTAANITTSNGRNRGFRQTCVRFLAALLKPKQPHASRMMILALPCGYFKIINPIVSFVGVEVIDGKPVGYWSDKSRHDQSVNQERIATFAESVKANHGVWPRQIWRQHSTWRTAVRMWLHAFDSAVAADFIQPFIADDWLPNFYRRIVLGHGARTSSADVMARGRAWINATSGLAYCIA